MVDESDAKMLVDPDLDSAAPIGDRPRGSTTAGNYGEQLIDRLVTS
jgi:hypothetical protein